MQLNSSLSHTAASARTTDSVLYNSDQAALLREKLIQLREQQQAEKDTSEEQPYHHSSATTASPADSQAERLKAIAADKIQRLKAMVTMMQQMATFATGEEAQAILRRLKMIVGELKQAVAMYAQAGGSGGGSANTAMPSAAPATDTGKGAPAATPSAPAPTAAPAQPQAATPTTESPAATKERDSKAASSIQAGMQTEQSSQNGQGSQDDEFLNEVEKLKRLIQQVARAAEQALRRDQSPNADLQQIYRDLKHIDKLSQEIASGQAPQGLAQSVQTIQAAYTASTTTGTVGNVQVNLAPPVVNTHT